MHQQSNSSSGMPPKARIPAPREYISLAERPSAQKSRPKKSRSKEQQSSIVGPYEQGRNHRAMETQESLADYSLAVDLHDVASQNATEIGSGLKKRKLNGKNSQTQLFIPSQKPIFKLLQAFKLQQYTKTFVDLGYGDDVYKLTMMSQRKKQELFGQIDFLPGHKQRLIDLFRKVDNLYPKQNVARTLESAMRVSSRQSQSRMSGSTVQESSLNVSASKNQHGGLSRESVTTSNSTAAAPTALSNQHTQNLLQTQPVSVQQVASGIPPPTQFPKRAQHVKSPSASKRSNQPSSLTRRFNALDAGQRTAINENFLFNIRGGIVQAATVSDALREFYGKDKATKQKVINKIFLTNMSGSKNQVKPHPSLAQAAGNVSAQGGFGLQKFVKVQKGTQVIDKYRSQVSSQGSGIGGQKSRTDAQPNRRMDKRAKNSNSSSESKQMAAHHLQQQPVMIRKGSHPDRRKKNKTSTSSERREGGILGAKMHTRQQLQTQARQQRVTSHSRVQLNPNSNFAIAPSSSRKDFSKLSTSKQQNDKSGRTRLHRVRSAHGYKDMPSSGGISNASVTITNGLQDYSQHSKAQQVKEKQKSAAQQAAIDRIKLHRQRSAKKQSQTQAQVFQASQYSGAWEERYSTKTGSKQSNQKPPTGSNTAMPQFIQQSQKPMPATTTSMRRRVSRDRAQIDLGFTGPSFTDAHNSYSNNGVTATADTTQDYSSGHLRLLKRASSQGASQRDIAQTQNCRRSIGQNNQNDPTGIGAPVSQSAAFTEFKIIKSPDELASAQNSTTLPAIETKSISSTVKKVIYDKADGLNADIESTHAIHPAAASAGKPPMSSSKRSRYSSKVESLQSEHSVVHSPDKAQMLALAKGIAGSSPRRPIQLEPINNMPLVPQVEIKPEVTAATQISSEPKLPENLHSNKTDQEETATDEATVISPKEDTNIPEEKVNHEAIKIKWSPLLEKQEKLEAREYGFSFGSKKVAMGPGFINLRFMCHCLARAIKRHLDFSKGEHWFLQDLQAEQNDIDLEFSYQLPPDLKLTLNPRGIRISSDDDDDDVNPFQREEQSPVRDIETMDIEVDAKNPLTQKPQSDSKLRQSTSVIGEPEPELIKSSDDEGSARLSNFKAQTHGLQFSNNQGPKQDTKAGDDDICEELGDYSDGGFYGDHDEDVEEQSIKEIRRDEMRKSVLEKDERKLNEYLNIRKVSELEHQLKNKDKQIAQLTRLVTNGFVKQEVMAISPVVEECRSQDDDEEGFYDRGGAKMDRAEWLMAQVDLDPIESHGSMEMSTTKFKSMQGKRFVNSENAGTALEDSNKTSKKQEAASQPKRVKKSANSYESAFIDVSEDKMREFVMSQLKHFDLRMEYDEQIFNEDQFVPMPAEKYIAEYCKYVTIACKMENEIPIVCLVYLEKLLLTTGILLNKWNWRRLVLICLCLASKIWDDDSLENVHFPKVMSDVTNLEINKLEQLFLEFIDYKLVIKGSEYAKYYFILRSLADDIYKEQQVDPKTAPSITPFENTRRNKSNKEEWAEFPLRAPISAEKMLELQKQEAKAEVYLKERHEREFLNAYIGNKQGSRKDATRHPSLLLDRTM